jgi:hypothetical protein
MDMGMMLEVLTPGVQDGGDADAGAEVLGIGGNGGEHRNLKERGAHVYAGDPTTDVFFFC